MMMGLDIMQKIYTEKLKQNFNKIKACLDTIF